MTEPCLTLAAQLLHDVQLPLRSQMRCSHTKGGPVQAVAMARPPKPSLVNCSGEVRCPGLRRPLSFSRVALLDLRQTSGW